jgi:uncharacterized membrane protein
MNDTAMYQSMMPSTTTTNADGVTYSALGVALLPADRIARQKEEVCESLVREGRGFVLVVIELCASSFSSLVWFVWLFVSIDRFWVIEWCVKYRKRKRKHESSESAMNRCEHHKHSMKIVEIASFVEQYHK